jgi:hypothetical protein
MAYTVKMQNDVARAAELAALWGVTDVHEGYEKIADRTVELITGYAEGTELHGIARSDFDAYVEQAL